MRSTWRSQRPAACDRSTRRDEHVRPFYELRLEPLAPADAVLLERADDEGVGREVELLRAPPRAQPRRRRAGSARDRSRSGSRGPRRRRPRRQDEVAHLGVGDLDPREAVRRAAAPRRPDRTPGSPAYPGRPCRYAVASRCVASRASAAERLEVARQEDALPRRTAPSPRGDLVTEPAPSPPGGVRPRRPTTRPLADREEPRVLGPARACAHRRAARRARGGHEASDRRAVIRAEPRGSGPQPPRAGDPDRGTALVELRDQPIERIRHLLRLVERDARLADELGMPTARPERPPAGRSRAPRAARSSTGRCGSAPGRRRCARSSSASARAERAEHADALERLVRPTRERQLVAVVIEVRVEPREDVRALVRVVRPARRDHADAPPLERLALGGRMEERRVDGVRDDHRGSTSSMPSARCASRL